MKAVLYIYFFIPNQALTEYIFFKCYNVHISIETHDQIYVS